MGVSEPVVICAFTLLLPLRHHSRTACTNLEQFFGREDLLAVDYKGEVVKNANIFVNPWDMGMGKEMGPTFWVLISIPLLKAFREEGLGLMFKENLRIYG